MYKHNAHKTYKQAVTQCTNMPFYWYIWNQRLNSWWPLGYLLYTHTKKIIQIYTGKTRSICSVSLNQQNTQLTSKLLFKSPPLLSTLGPVLHKVLHAIRIKCLWLSDKPHMHCIFQNSVTGKRWPLKASLKGSNRWRSGLYSGWFRTSICSQWNI
jgi:hypothetical protein